MHDVMRTWLFVMAVSVAALSTSYAGAQTSPASAPTDSTLRAVARDVIVAAKYATFITAAPSGQPSARTVQPQLPTTDWEVWFATNPRSRKVAEVRRNPRVVLHYADAATLSYVSLIGRADVITDRATKDAHWDAAWSAFYPDRDTSVALIRVRASKLEVVSINRHIEGDTRTWRAPSVLIARPAKPAR